MDGVTPFPQEWDPLRCAMPAPAPLDMPVQDPRACPPRPADQTVPKLWRLAVFAPAIALTAGLITALLTWLSTDGLLAVEIALTALIALTFIWVAISLSTAAIGLTARSHRPRGAPPERPLSTALLIPVYNEDPAAVAANARAMLDALARRPLPGETALFILSDTTDPQIAAAEWRLYLRLAAEAPLPVHYRRRRQNTDQKSGNIADWVRNHGAAWDAMLILDADSLMSARTIRRLIRTLAAEPQTGLIQTAPALIGAQTLFARAQEFANMAYGWLLAEGLSLWSGTEANYWGHNAIIRTKAFAQAAGLPHLGRQTILSHDFVEAAFLRRAGWHVRLLPGTGGSFEETPATLIDHTLRDRRWCRGNLQHLRLLTAKGLHPVSRFHLFHGAMSYLLSPAWFVLLVIWALRGTGEATVLTYFTPDAPLYPIWPEMSPLGGLAILAALYGALLAPKLAGAAAIATRPAARRRFGGTLRLATSTLFEIVLSVIYAPIQMIQQMQAVVRAALGLGGWTPQSRRATNYPLTTLLRFHALETALGALLTAGLLTGLVSLWLIPIAASLTLAIPLSALSGLSRAKVPAVLRLSTPQSLHTPRIARDAEQHRRRYGAAETTHEDDPFKDTTLSPIPAE